MGKKGVFLILCIMVLAAGGIWLKVQGGSAVLTKSFAGNATLTLGYERDVESLSPLDNSPEVLTRTLNIYEGLVILDRTLHLQPGIALSYGQTDPTHWEFKLRENLLFHNGQKVTVEDVVHSFEAFQANPNGDYSLENIDEIIVRDAQTINISTKRPDALLLQKIAPVFIFPRNLSMDQLREGPVGTGPYKLLTWEKSKLLQLTRNDFYWGESPEVKNIRMLTLTDTETTKNMLDNRAVDILVDVAAPETSAQYDTYIIPMLYHNFLFFHLQHPYLNDVSHRKSITEIVQAGKVSYIGEQADPTLFPTEQFISSGTVGYNPNIQKSDTKNMDAFDGDGISLSLAYDASMNREAGWIQEALRKNGLNVHLRPLDAQNFVEAVQAGTADMFLFGWMFNYGDAGEFFDKVIHSRSAGSGYGIYNGTHYANAEIDALIEESGTLTDPTRRLKNLQNINYTITKKDIIGVPLFEVRKLFVVRQGVPFQPRLDGYLLGKDIQL